MSGKSSVRKGKLAEKDIEAMEREYFPQYAKFIHRRSAPEAGKKWHKGDVAVFAEHCILNEFDQEVKHHKTQQIPAWFRKLREEATETRQKPIIHTKINGEWLSILRTADFLELSRYLQGFIDEELEKNKL